MASKVYFSDLRTDFGNNLIDKLNRVMDGAGIGSIPFEGRYVAIKMHFGEPGNLAFLRPNWAKCVADKVKSLGGKPFLTDCNTLYVGGRKNALDHLSAATENGFSPLTTGCHVIIADGLKGEDDTEVPIDGRYVKRAKIGRAIMDADIIISLSHFKGHEATGFGGALKNLGMGSGSRRGKMEMHKSGKPVVVPEKCVSCRKCSAICAHSAQSFETGKCVIDHEKCVGCGRCLAICPKDAIIPGSDHSNELLNSKMMEYAKAVVSGRPSFHVSVAVDISPCCDCHSENDAPIVPNVGIFASFDPVALDAACADAVNSMPVNPNTMLGDSSHTHHDHFTDMHPDTNWKQGLEYAESIGLGTTEYEIVDLS